MAKCLAKSKSQCGSQLQYNQEEKKECRSRLFEHAVKCLTTDRDTSVCVQRYHGGEIWKKLQETGEAKQYFSFEERRDIQLEIEKWESVHKGLVGFKKPSDLRVCYLCGNNPVNDLEVLIENGVLPQNVWAIEKDAAAFEGAQEAIKGYPHLKNVKLFKGDFVNFVNHIVGQFDIIYYDACGTLPSARQNTLKFIGYVFLLNKLNSPGAMITNFSFPPEQPGQNDDKERNQISFLSGEYLKHRLSNTLDFQDGPDEIKLDRIASTLSSRTVEDIYSDYVTYQVIDSACLYIPAYRMLSSSKGSKSQPLWDQMFVRRDDFLKEVKLNDVASSSDSSSSRAVYDTASKSFLRKIGATMKDSPFAKEKERNCIKAWVAEIFPDWMSSELKNQDITSMLLTHHLSCSEDFIKTYANKDFQAKCLSESIFKTSDGDEHGGTTASFCNIPDSSSATCLVGGLLYGQLAYPSFPVVDKLLRLTYTAKQRQMFSDVFIFDKCRYIFDQFPSVHSAYSAIIEPRQRVVLQMALDGMTKQLKTICYKDFWNVAGLHVNNMYIPQREMIKPSLMREGDEVIKEL